MKIGLAIGERLKRPGAIKGCDGTGTYYSLFFLRLARADGEEEQRGRGEEGKRRSYSTWIIDGRGKISMERGKELG